MTSAQRKDQFSFKVSSELMQKFKQKIGHKTVTLALVEYIQGVVDGKDFKFEKDLVAYDQTSKSELYERLQKLEASFFEYQKQSDRHLEQIEKILFQLQEEKQDKKKLPTKTPDQNLGFDDFADANFALEQMGSPFKIEVRGDRISIRGVCLAYRNGATTRKQHRFALKRKNTPESISYAVMVAKSLTQKALRNEAINPEADLLVS